MPERRHLTDSLDERIAAVERQVKVARWIGEMAVTEALRRLHGLRRSFLDSSSDDHGETKGAA